MSMLLMVQAMQVSVGNPLRKLVLIKLADNANDYGECWPSYQHIADQCEIGKSTVRKHIKDLEKSGLLQIENRKGPKGNASNIYKLTLTPIAPNSTGVAADSTPPVAPDSTGTSHSLEPVKEPKEKSTKKESLDFSPLGFTAEQVNEFKRIRKHAKADITQRVINTIGKQLDLTRQAGYSNDQILDVWVSKSWRSYEHQWFINATQQKDTVSFVNVHARGPQEQISRIEREIALLDSSINSEKGRMEGLVRSDRPEHEVAPSKRLIDKLNAERKLLLEQINTLRGEVTA